MRTSLTILPVLAGLCLVGAARAETNAHEDEHVRHKNEIAGFVGLTVGYEFDLGKTNATPSFSADFDDGEQIYVLGVAIVFGF